MSDPLADMLSLEDIMHTSTPPPQTQPEFVQGSSSRPMSNQGAMLPPYLPPTLDDGGEPANAEELQAEQLVRQASTIAELTQQRAYLLGQMEEERARWEAERYQTERSQEALIAQFRAHQRKSQENGMSYREMELSHTITQIKSENAALKHLLQAVNGQLSAVHTELARLRPVLLNDFTPTSAQAADAFLGEASVPVPPPRPKKRKRKQGTPTPVRTANGDDPVAGSSNSVPVASSSAQPISTSVALSDPVRPPDPPPLPERNSASSDVSDDEADRTLQPSPNKVPSNQDPDVDMDKPAEERATSMEKQKRKFKEGYGRKRDRERRAARTVAGLVGAGNLEGALRKVGNELDHVESEDEAKGKSKEKEKEKSGEAPKEKDRGRSMLSDARAEHLLIAARRVGRERARAIVQREADRREKEARERHARTQALEAQITRLPAQVQQAQAQTQPAHMPAHVPQTPTRGAPPGYGSPHAYYAAYMVPAPDGYPHPHPPGVVSPPGRGQVMLVPMGMPYAHLMPGTPARPRIAPSVSSSVTATPSAFDSLVSAATAARDAEPPVSPSPAPKRRKVEGKAGEGAVAKADEAGEVNGDRAGKAKAKAKESGGKEARAGSDSPRKMSALDVLADQAAMSASKDRERERERASMAREEGDGSPRPHKAGAAQREGLGPIPE